MVYMNCTFCPTGKDELMFLKGEKEGGSGREGEKKEEGRAMS